MQHHEHYADQDAASGKAIGEPFIIWSPNNNDLGSDAICARNAECHNTGFEFEGEFSKTGGVPGGPREYPDDKKPWL